MTTSGAVQEMALASGTGRRTRLHVGLWVAQGLLAAAFGVAGLTHATRPIAEMAKMAPWTGALPEGLVRFIGVVELAGALVRPALTGWAAAGLAAVMALAMVVHIARGEPQVLPVNLVLGGIAAFIAWGRGMKTRRT